MNFKKILFIGRFQPFHLGHLAVLKEIDSRNDVEEIIISVGSSQYVGTAENPYSYEQRVKMIEAVCKQELHKKCRVVAIPDVHSNDIWVGHVAKLIGQFDEVYTGNNLVRRLFLAKNYQVRPVNNYQGISATKIRKMINQGDQTWKKLVPAVVVDLIK